MRHRALFVLPFAAALALAACEADTMSEPGESLEDRAGFIVGHQLGSSLHEQAQQLESDDTDLSDDAILAGFRAGLSGDSIPFTPSQMDSIMRAFQDSLVARAGSKARREGEAFLATYDEGEDVMTTESGLRYRVIEEGSGEQPDADDTVLLNYSGMLTDSTEFDRGQSARFPVSGVVPGFSEALQLMRPGGRYEVVIPPELGYGDAPNGPGGPGQTLIFTVDLLEIVEE